MGGSRSCRFGVFNSESQGSLFEIVGGGSRPKPALGSHVQASVRLDVTRRVTVPEMTSLSSSKLQLFLTLAYAAIHHGPSVEGFVRAAAEQSFGDPQT